MAPPGLGPGGGLGWRSAAGLARAALVLAWRAAPWTMLLFVVVSLVGGVGPVALAWLTKLVLDGLARPGGPEVEIGMVVALAGAGGVVGVLPHAVQFVRADLDRAVALAAQDELYAAVGRFQGLARFEDPAFLTRLQLAVQSGRMTAGQLVGGLLDGVRDVITMAGFVVTLLTLSPLMALLVIVAVLPAVPAELAISRRRADMFLSIGPARRREAFYADLLTSLPAAKEVRLFGLSGFFRARMLRELRAVNAAERAVDLRDWWTQNGLGVLGAVLAAAGLVWAILQARAGRFTVGDVTVFVTAVTGLESAVGGLVGQLGTMSQALLLFKHFQEVKDAPPDLPSVEPPRPVPPLRHGIELRDVWFRYGDDQPWVLRGVNLFLPRGRAVALVGANGAGKSTVVKLLCRLYDPTRGAVLWDGVDLRALPVEAVRERIGAAFQDYMAYELTAAENVGVGDLRLLEDRRRIEAAAHRAGAHGTLARLPYGYDTLLSRQYWGDVDDGDPRSGVLLSGGQWQRVALARAFLRDGRDLLILDEPSAALDAEAEYKLHTRLREHRAGRTSLLISHRLGTVRDADHIVVLDRGRVAEAGRHDQLMAYGGIYARLFTLQARGYSRSRPAAPAPGPRAQQVRQGQPAPATPPPSRERLVPPAAPRQPAPVRRPALNRDDRHDETRERP